MRECLKLLSVALSATVLICSTVYVKSDKNAENQTTAYTVKATETEVETIEITTEPVETVEETEETEETYAEYWSKDWGAYDSYLLEKIAMAEAEGEDTEGKALVIMVVLNRVWDDDFPDSIHDVIFQQIGGRYQFSVMEDGGRFWTTDPDRDCYEALLLVMNGWDESEGATYFEASYNTSSWHRDNLEYLFQHGGHLFYKDKEVTDESS